MPGLGIGLGLDLGGGAGTGGALTEAVVAPRTTMLTAMSVSTPSTAALRVLPADGVVRLDVDPHIGRAGNVADAAYYQGDRLHLTGTADSCGNGAKAALMAAAFTAAQPV